MSNVIEDERQRFAFIPVELQTRQTRGFLMQV